MPVSRRRLIYLAVTAGGAVIVLSATGGLLYLGGKPGAVENGTRTTTANAVTKQLNITSTTTTTSTQAKMRFSNPYTENGKSLVSVVQGSGRPEDVPEMVKNSVAVIGGIEKIDVKGKKVFVKPNTNSNHPPPAVTSPLIVGTVVKMLMDAGAAEVKVGDCSNINNQTSQVMMDQGIQRAVEDAGGEVVFLDQQEYVTVSMPWGKWLTETRISKPVYEAERLIDLPVIKSHNVAGFTMSMKNFVGAIHKSSRLDPSWLPSTTVFHSCGNPSEAVAELNVLVKPDLIVMDGTKSLVSYGEGDDAGEVRDTNLVVASGDRVANDIVGLSVIKSFGLWPMVTDKDVWAQGTIQRALELSLGQRSDKIKIISKSLVGQEKLDPLLQKIHSISGIPA
ncbi:MAG: DUF362 domain-containing protein [Thaumarchaeota archaeon]|nr:DUF362 domain-containing protein [Nitrososphaerota archaeon]